VVKLRRKLGDENWGGKLWRKIWEENWEENWGVKIGWSK